MKKTIRILCLLLCLSLVLLAVSYKVCVILIEKKDRGV